MTENPKLDSPAKLYLPIRPAETSGELTPSEASLRDFIHIELVQHCVADREAPEYRYLDTWKTFDELFEDRREIQLGSIVVPRDPFLKKFYEDSAALFNEARYKGYRLWEITNGGMVALNGLYLDFNAYPYNVPKDTLHLVLWHWDDTPREQISFYLAKVFSHSGVGMNDFIIFNNPAGRRSMPDIDHHHIFVRRNVKLLDKIAGVGEEIKYAVVPI
jgi:hypothetical protein